VAILSVMDSFLVVVDELRSTQTRVSDIAADLHIGVERASNDIESLLDGGWSGVAATAFAAGWSQWQSGAAQLAEALARIGTALAETTVAYAESDSSSSSSFRRLAAIA
jgi:WXG100 family type VII secretion target